MPEAKKSFFSIRLLIDVVLGGVCIALLFTMLQQQDALKKIEADMDKLRAQVGLRKGEMSHAAQPKQEPASVSEQSKKQ